MAEQSFQDKTEPATPKKREDARKKGQVAKSREISSVAILTTGIVYMFFNARSMTMELGDSIRRKFAAIPVILNEKDPYINLMKDTLQEFIMIILPIMIILDFILIIKKKIW